MEGSESQLRATMPVFLNSFNQPTYLEGIVETLLANDFGRIIICDNASASSKTLSLLDKLSAIEAVEVRHLGDNLGPHRTLLQIRQETEDCFLFSDPDLALPKVLPNDFLTVLLSLSRKYRCRKVGLALEIPPADQAREITMRDARSKEFTVQEWEKQFWEHPLETNVYRARVDTTFFLWNPKIRIDFLRDYMTVRNRLRPKAVFRPILPTSQIDIRVARDGFTARHLPWYEDDGFPEDEREFYIKEAARWSTWLRESGDLPKEQE